MGNSIIDGVHRNNIAYDNDHHGFNICTSSSSTLFENNKPLEDGAAGLVVQRGSEGISWPHEIQIVGGKYHGHPTE